MELTKEQIQYIDDRLENDGIKYWDIRIEMLDHVIIDVEHQLQKGETFKTAVQNSFISLGWKENFNGSSFESIMKKKQIFFAKKYRKSFWAYFKSCVFKPNSIIWISSFITVLYMISYHKLILKYTLFIFLTTIVIFYFYFLTKYKVYKSIQLNKALTKIFLSLSLINIYVFIPKMFEIDVFKFHFLTTLFFSIVFIQSFLGIHFFLKEYTKINNTYQKLISL